MSGLDADEGTMDLIGGEDLAHEERLSILNDLQC